MTNLRLVFTAFAGFCIGTAASLSYEQIAADLEALLSDGSDVQLLADGSDWPSDFTPRWSITTPPSYRVAAKPRVVEDVQHIVTYASQNEVPFLTTGGGHGYSATLGRLHEGLSIDLSLFNGIDIDPQAGTMTTGGGVISSDVVHALYEAGMEAPVGLCACIGYSGATLGGGIGPYSGLHGTQSDSLLSVKVVIASGEVMTVSAKENSDLFYGMKGAGANFGVVTSFTYKIHPATNHGMAMNADMMFPGAINASLWELARSFAGKQPGELSITLSISYNATIHDLVLIANFIYAGPEEKGRKLIKPFLDLRPMDLHISMVPWRELQEVAVYGLPFAGCRRGSFYVPQSLNLYKVDVKNLISVANYMKAEMDTKPELQSVFIAWAQYSPKGFAKFQSESSAFPHRDVVAFVQVDGFASDRDHIPSVDEFGKELQTRLQKGSGRRDLSVYVNFAHGDEPPKAWYSAAKLPKLRGLKKKYDPRSLFSFYNPIE
jgi:hypothetical protein